MSQLAGLREIYMEYTSENRGAIQYRERAKQIIDFSGLRYGNITPTDIDGYIDFHNQLTILMEFKYGNAKLPYGQKLAYQRMIDDIENSGKPAYLLVCSHNIENWQKDIPAAYTYVKGIYYKKNWYVGNGMARDVINEIKYMHSLKINNQYSLRQ